MSEKVLPSGLLPRQGPCGLCPRRAGVSQVPSLKHEAVRSRAVQLDSLEDSTDWLHGHSGPSQSLARACACARQLCPPAPRSFAALCSEDSKECTSSKQGAQYDSIAGFKALRVPACSEEALRMGGERPAMRVVRRRVLALN